MTRSAVFFIAALLTLPMVGPVVAKNKSKNSAEVLAKKFEKELQAMQKSQTAKTSLYNHLGKSFGMTKNMFGFINDLSSGHYTAETLFVLDKKNHKFFGPDFTKRFAPFEKQLIGIKAKQPTYDINKGLGHISNALTIFNIGGHIINALSGDNSAKLNAVTASANAQMGWMAGKYGTRSLSIAMAGVSFLDYALNEFISAQYEQYSVYWWQAYSRYLNRHYKKVVTGPNSWAALIEKGGHAAVEVRLYEFWNDPLVNAATEYRDPSPFQRNALAAATFKKPFAARYYKEYLHPTLRTYFQKKALEAKNEALDKAEAEMDRLQEFITGMRGVQVFIEDAGRVMKGKQPKIEQLVVSAEKGGKTHTPALTPKDTPHLFAYFTIPELKKKTSYKIRLRIIDFKTGTELLSKTVEKPFKAGASSKKRVGMRIEKSFLKPGDKAWFEAAFLPINKGAQEKRVEFMIKGSDSVLEGFTIKATRDSYDGPLLTGKVANDDILAFQADVPHPESETPLLTELFWQLYDANGAAIDGISKKIQAVESGKSVNYRFRFRLKDLENGRYKVALTHRLVNDEDVSVQAVSHFDLYQAVKITRLVVTANPKDQSGRDSLYADEKPHFYAHYELAKAIPGVDVEMEITDKRTGKNITRQSLYRERKEGKIQRVGFALKKGTIKTGTTAVFKIKLTPPGGDARSDSQPFTVTDYSLTLNIPNPLYSGKTKRFSIGVPSAFEKPYTVDIPSVRHLSIGYRKSKLTGTITGIATQGEESAKVFVTVSDINGRVASASKRVTILPKKSATSRKKSNVGSSSKNSEVSPFWAHTEYKIKGNGSTAVKLADCLRILKRSHGGYKENTKKHDGRFGIYFGVYIHSADDIPNSFSSVDVWIKRFKNLRASQDSHSSHFNMFFETSSESEAMRFGRHLCHNPDYPFKLWGQPLDPYKPFPKCDSPCQGLMRKIPPKPWR